MHQRTSHSKGYILALSGPSGVGKSTVCSLLQSACADCLARVPILTTRGPKAGDDGEYAYVTRAEFDALIAAGAMVAHTTIPSSSEPRRYGYRASDIHAIWSEGKLPVVITEMHLLQGLASYYGRRHIVSFGLLPPGKSKRMMLSHLLHRLRARGRESEDQIQDRLQNAEDDLRFFEERVDLFNRLLVNEHLPTVMADVRNMLAEFLPVALKTASKRR